MTVSLYPAARMVAATIRAYFEERKAASTEVEREESAPIPDATIIETIIDVAFWASLRREEGYAPKISLAFLESEHAGQPLLFERQIPLTPAALSKLAPAVERPGIHLGVWHDAGEIFVWGTTRRIPRFCFVLEVIEPGLLIIKYRRGEEPGKFVNVVVINGDEIKMLDERGTNLPDCPSLLTKLLGFGSPAQRDLSVNVLVQLAASMRAHGRGGSLLVVPKNSDNWRQSIIRPVSYTVDPPFSELSELLRAEPDESNKRIWQESLIDAIEAVAGTTAVDGATLINDQYELLAFGAKIGRPENGTPIDQIIVTEPIIGNSSTIVHPVQLGGTRHLSAAQFVQDQKNSIALVASQDGRFTVFAWSPCEAMVHAHRVETLLL